MAGVKRDGSLQCNDVFSLEGLSWVGGRRGESGEELKLILRPLKTHVRFNHQLLPVLPLGS